MAVSKTKLKAKTRPAEKASIKKSVSEEKPDPIQDVISSDATMSPDISSDIKFDTGKKDFTEYSPLLTEEVISRENTIKLDAQPSPDLPPMSQGDSSSKPEAKQVKAEKKNLFMKPPKEEEQQEGSSDDIIHDEEEDDSLPGMKIETPEGPSIDDIKKKAGQTTAEYTWALFEQFVPWVQGLTAKFDIGEMKDLVNDDKLDRRHVEFAKEHNQSLEEEFELKDWEKELIYPPYEEMLEESGKNTLLSPAHRLGIGLSVVIVRRFKEARKYRNERDGILERLLSNFEEFKKANKKDDKKDEIPLVETEEVKGNKAA